jgi:hypothetical protein
LGETHSPVRVKLAGSIIRRKTGRLAGAVCRGDEEGKEGGKRKRNGAKTCLGAFGLMVGVFILVFTRLSNDNFGASPRPMLRGTDIVHTNLLFEFPTLRTIFPFFLERTQWRNSTTRPTVPLGGLKPTVRTLGLSDADKAEVDYLFRSGFSYLHAFENLQAVAQFAASVSVDPNCLACYAGLSFALEWNYGYRRAKMEAIKATSQFKGMTNETFSKDEKALLEIATVANRTDYCLKAFPSSLSVELGAYCSFVLVDASIGVQGAPLQPLRQIAQRRLQDLAQQYPQHVGVAHYIVHAYEDDRQPEIALQVVEVLNRIKWSAHLVHMPGHVYSLVGNSQMAFNSFQNSYNLERTLHEGRDPFSMWPNAWNYIHNQAYHVSKLIEDGQRKKAISMAERIATGLCDEKVLAHQRTSNKARGPAQPLLLSPKFSRTTSRVFYQGLVALPFVYIRNLEFKKCEESLTSLQKKVARFPVFDHYLEQYYGILRQYCTGMATFYPCISSVAKTNGKMNAKGAFQGFINIHVEPPICKKTDLGASANPLLTRMENSITSLTKLLHMKGIPFTHRMAVNRVGVEPDYFVEHRAVVALHVHYLELKGVIEALTDPSKSLVSLEEAVKAEEALPYNEPVAYPRSVRETRGDVYMHAVYNSKSGPALSGKKKREYLQMAEADFTHVIDSPQFRRSGYAFWGIVALRALNGEAKESIVGAIHDFQQSWRRADHDMKSGSTYGGRSAKEWLEKLLA